MYQLFGELSAREGINLEPSALAGMMGVVHVSSSLHYQTRLQLTDERLKNATHLVWATGGGMVPEAEMSAYLAKS
ncbi:D-serine dehydratase, partial [Escherichia coli]|nr:D-serine dehydratase [Escherichia coli]